MSSSGDVHVSSLHFWNSESPSFRYFLLFLATLVPFGGHVVKSSISSLTPLILADHSLNLTNTDMGALQSAVSVPNLLIPLLGGLWLDVKGSRYGTMFALSLCVIGQLLFAVAFSLGSYSLALVARVLFGLGQGSTVVAQGRLAAKWFDGHELIAAVALTESAHNIANFIGSVAPALLAKQLDNQYVEVLYISVGATAISFVAGLVFFSLTKNDAGAVLPDTAEADNPPAVAVRIPWSRRSSTVSSRRASIIRSGHHSRQRSRGASALNVPDVPGPGARSGAHSRQRSRNESRVVDQKRASLATDSLTVPGHLGGSYQNEISPLVVGDWIDEEYDVVPEVDNGGGISIGFLLLCTLHMLFSNTYHLFGYVVSNVMYSDWSYSVSSSALLGGTSQGLAVFLCPLLGYLLDRYGYKMYWCTGAGFISAFAYLALAFHLVNPVASLIALSFCISFVPTVLRAAVPALVSPSLLGAAYGAYEVSEAVGASVGHVLVGYVKDKTHSYEQDLILFACMAGLAGFLSFTLSSLDSYMGGSLNEPSIKVDEVSPGLHGIQEADEESVEAKH